MPSTLTPNRSERRDELLSSEFMHQLDRLDVLSRKILAGKMQGERRSKNRGQSVEFADYRPYVAGDDLRFIDWNLYARLERLFLRLFLEEEDLTVSVLLDVSRSMAWGEPSKFLYVRRLAAALGYIGLVNHNRVQLTTFAASIVSQTPPWRGRRPVREMLEFLRGQNPVDGPGDLAQVCKRFAVTQRGKGVVVLVSDFFDKGDLPTSLRYFGGDRFDVYAIQVLAPQEIDPAKGNLVGDLRLRDIEDGNLAEVSVGPALLKRYQANLQAYCQHLRDQCVRRGIAYMVSDTSVPLEQLVLRYLRERGLVG